MTIRNCSFCCNHPATSLDFFPGGIHVQFSTAHFKSNTKYSVTDCRFENNTQQVVLKIDPRPSLSPSLATEYGYGLGGGMGVLFMNESQNITVLIQGCTFLYNVAHSGGGLYVHFQDNARGNAVAVIDSDFIGNQGTGGGGLAIGMSRISGRGNHVQVNGSKFTANTARYGGGTKIFAIHGDETEDGDMKLVKFHNCTWKYNFGPYSPAVDILAFRSDQFNSGHLPTPQFTDCMFSFNRVDAISHNGTSHLFSGVFVISSLTVYFGGRMTFNNNKYTALKMTSGRIRLLEGTQAYFGSNEGNEGGAIAMYGSSALVGNKNCHLHFDNNSAMSVGGGILYGPIEQREFLEGKSCFLQYAGLEKNLTKRNFTLLFTNNFAQLGGSSIYATSFYSCFFACHRDLKKYKLIDFLYCIGTFVFQDSSDDVTYLRTRGINYNYNQTVPLLVIPGQLATIPISFSDEFGHKTQTLLIVERDSDKLNSAIFAHNVTRIFGKPLENDSLLFRTQDSFRSYYYRVPITFRTCPPGFYFDPKAMSCNCSADNSRYAYGPIVKCNYTTFRALILRGYWAGMCDDACTNGTKLYVSSYSKVTSLIRHYSDYSINELPQTEEELNSFMCGEKRRGVLCGRCQENRSAYYHSRGYKCGSKELCHLGSIFFFLSEIVPVVTVFSIILRYNFSFQSGYLNGFILFCQVVEVSAIKLNKLNRSVMKREALEAFKILQMGYQLVYDVFSLEFFSIEPLSFCLWDGARVMDVIVFKYITTVCTFLLVFFLFRIMNNRCLQCCGRRPRIKHAVTKGLSAFLVLCYSQCTKITFQILSREVIISNEGSPDIPVTEYGGLRYFHSEHLLYAVPALICSLTLVSLPVLYLLIIPLMLQLLSICGLSEHAVVNTLLRILCQPRLMPLIDMFQSCFKPKLRFFAGAYFAYRIAIFAVLTFSKDEAQFYAVSELIFLAILGLHAIAQPYKEKRNNVVDGMLFLNLAVINGLNITVMNNSSNGPSITTFIIAAQLLLVTSPLIIIICRYCLVAVRKKIQAIRGRHSYEGIGDRNPLSDNFNGFLEDRGTDNSEEQSLLSAY